MPDEPFFDVVAAAVVVSAELPDVEAGALPEAVVVADDLTVVVFVVVEVELLIFAVVVGCDGGFRYEAAEVFIAVCICVVLSPKGTPFA